jgi:hypothetical protein
LRRFIGHPKAENKLRRSSAEEIRSILSVSGLFHLYLDRH